SLSAFAGAAITSAVDSTATSISPVFIVASCFRHARGVRCLSSAIELTLPRQLGSLRVEQVAGDDRLAVTAYLVARPGVDGDQLADRSMDRLAVWAVRDVAEGAFEVGVTAPVHVLDHESLVRRNRVLVARAVKVDRDRLADRLDGDARVAHGYRDRLSA